MPQELCETLLRFSMDNREKPFTVAVAAVAVLMHKVWTFASSYIISDSIVASIRACHRLSVHLALYGCPRETRVRFPVGEQT